MERLQLDDFVSNGHFTSVPPAILSGFGELAGQFSGYFVRPRNGFIGFAFNGGAGKQYGWARVRMSGYNEGNGFKVLGYAYADPSESIQTGQTSDDEQTPSPMGSLGVLAAGAAVLVAWRKRQRRPPLTTC